ncbi:MAG: DUF2914 domain-containing protein [Patescibacteria group bacterium]
MSIEHISNYLGITKIKYLYARYERYLMPAALVLGFISDIATFRLVKFETALFILLIQLFLAGGSIFLIFFELGLIRNRFLSFLRVFSPLILQYALGSVFSASVIFYSYSGSLRASWPFILVLVLLMISNEIFKKYYSRPIFVLSVYFFAIFSFILLAAPYVTHRLGSLVFFSSGIISLIIIAIFIYLVQIKFPQIREKIKSISVSIASVFVLINVFYFTNVIPPFPLSLKDAGVYHFIERTNSGDYNALVEKKLWHDFFFPKVEYHVTSSQESVYLFSSVFAPAELNMDIVHEWQYKDGETKKWKTLNSVYFPVMGGRPEGYRGYSVKTNITPGEWRVNVKTPKGQTIGRVSFSVLEVSEKPALELEIK